MELNHNCHVCGKRLTEEEARDLYIYIDYSITKHLRSKSFERDNKMYVLYFCKDCARKIKPRIFDKIIKSINQILQEVK